jgi:pimeloyl-ACP methyl ester carboxylesterase
MLGEAARWMVLLWLWLASAASAANGPSGTWVGTFTREGAEIAVSLRVDAAATAPAAFLSANDLRIVDLPLRDVSVSGERVAFALAGDATVMRFEGRVEGDRFTGTIDENGRAGTFALRRASGQSPGDCVPRPAAFANGPVGLRGTLLRPIGGPARVPAVLLIHGSGAEPRDAGRFLATALCRGGVAALIYDKRGVGESTGNWRDSGFEDLAGDAVAGLDWLARQADLDPRRLGLYGHSQGGSIAPMIANRSPHVAFLIAGAGAGVPMPEVERFSLWNAVRPLTADPRDAAEARAYVDRLVAVAASGEGIAEFVADAPRFRDRRWFAMVEPPPPDAGYWRLSRRTASYDAANEWRRVRQPALLLYGAMDERTPVEASVAAIRAATAGNPRIRIVIFPGAEHAFSLVAPGQPWPRVAAGYPGQIVEFAARAGR